MLIGDLETQIDEVNHRLRAGGADHPYIPLLMTTPGIHAAQSAHRSPPKRRETLFACGMASEGLS
jgi:hypothetical protein